MRHTSKWMAALVVSGSICIQASGAPAGADVDPALAAKIIVKVLAMDEGLPSRAGGGIVVGVHGSDAAFDAFSQLKGQAISKESSLSVSQVVKVDAMPPTVKPTVLFCGPSCDPAAASKYAQGAKVLSTTNVASYVENGISLGVGVEANKPKILLNLQASDAEGISWNPNILKIAKKVK